MFGLRMGTEITTPYIILVIIAAIISTKETVFATAGSCFISCTVGRRFKRFQEAELTPLKMQSLSMSMSKNHSSSSLPMGSNNHYGEFNLQKARLMARFSSVAYEDPPKSRARKDNMAGLEQFVDSHDVTITRPIIGVPEKNYYAGSSDNVWEMSHTEAMSPRPLMAMFSDCNISEMLGGNDSFDQALSSAEFQWEALATNKKTSTQFDVWRITTPQNEKSNDDILVVAFRGTRLSSFIELYTDIQLKQDMINCVDLGVCCMDEEENDSSTKGNVNEAMDGDGAEKHIITLPQSNRSTVMAHSGFLKAYASIRQSLLQLLADKANTYDKIWFTGHSLGAALATLAVVDVGSVMNGDSDMATLKSIDSVPLASGGNKVRLPKAKLSSYLFGTPRVGNREFADRLARLQREPGSIVHEYYRVNTPGDAVPFLPRGKVVNRLGIDYVHAGASVFLPTLSSDNDQGIGDKGMDDSLERKSKVPATEQDQMKESYNQWMMQLEEETIEQLNKRIFQSEGSTATNAKTKSSANEMLSKLRIYPKGDKPPDPLSEIDPDYSGFFPVDPGTWIFSKSFQNFLLGETVRSFRILRGGFVKNHRLSTYENGLCLASQDDLVLINPLK